VLPDTAPVLAALAALAASYRCSRIGSRALRSLLVPTAPFGRWNSPLRASDVAAAKVSLSELCSDGAALYWLESRPSEGGRVVLVRSDEAGSHDHSPPGVSIRSRVHEYGGGAVCLVPGAGAGAFAYVDQSDQRVWFCEDPLGLAPEPRPLSPVPSSDVAHRHGGLAATPDGSWVLAARESRPAGGGRPVRAVVALCTGSSEPHASVVVEGHDFFGAPTVDAEGARLAVVTWDHPDMPWDASLLLVVSLASRRTTAGVLELVASGSPVTVAGGRDESVGQPAWQGNGTLRSVSDRRGWWQPYEQAGRSEAEERYALTDVEAEFHSPDWVLGQSTMAELAGGTVVARASARGRDSVVVLDHEGATATPREIDQPCVTVTALCAHGDGVAFLGSTPDAVASVWTCAPDSSARLRRGAPAAPVEPADIALGEPLAVTGRAGRPVHATLYRPVLHATSGPPGVLPPLVVWSHGGPTSSSPAGLDLTVQFFTTRGFALACVDYSGSSGYGRAYRDTLRGGWGVVDAEDCVDVARHLAGAGEVDGSKMAIRGGSAGGMTALNALAAGAGFAACASWYGVTDLLGLVATTHDFEAHYTDRLIGVLPACRALYEDRSPVNRAAEMHGAVLLLQGTDDAVVPPAQAERMRDALVAAGVGCELRFFEGEGHGFRRADTLTDALGAELAFYLDALDL
jgi:dipeptidyl aminopeptidase/acylaminoacyl peptidase